jgi:hypothetical protein
MAFPSRKGELFPRHACNFPPKEKYPPSKDELPVILRLRWREGPVTKVRGKQMRKWRAAKTRNKRQKTKEESSEVAFAALGL